MLAYNSPEYGMETERVHNRKDQISDRFQIRNRKSIEQKQKEYRIEIERVQNGNRNSIEYKQKEYRIETKIAQNGKRKSTQYKQKDYRIEI